MVSTIVIALMTLFTAISLYLQFDIAGRVKLSHLGEHYTTVTTSMWFTGAVTVGGLLYLVINHVRLVA